MSVQRCAGCGAAVEGGTASCRALFDEVLVRDYSDPAYFRCHKLVVDCYALQHPDEFCRSAKSLASHLVGLSMAIESGPADRPSVALKRWLDGSVKLAKPSLPAERGSITLSDLPMDGTAEGWCIAVPEWAEEVWSAYTPLHSLVREWRRAAERD